MGCWHHTYALLPAFDGDVVHICIEPIYNPALKRTTRVELAARHAIKIETLKKTAGRRESGHSWDTSMHASKANDRRRLVGRWSGVE